MSSLTLILPGKGWSPGPHAAGGCGLTSSAISIAGLQLVLTQQTRDDTHLLRNRVGKQGGKGPAAVTSLPSPSPEACARREALRSLDTGSRGDASWGPGFLVKAPEE